MSKSSANLTKMDKTVDFHKRNPTISRILVAKTTLANKLSGKNPKAEMEKQKLENSKIYSSVENILGKQTALKSSEAEFLVNFLSNKSINKLNQETKVTNKLRNYFTSNANLNTTSSTNNLRRKSKSSNLLRLPTKITKSNGDFLGSKESLFSKKSSKSGSARSSRKTITKNSRSSTKTITKNK
jgi:hypothetical protein